MSRADRIHAVLSQALDPAVLTVRDDSHHHAGHAGHRPEGETHYHVTAVSARFAGLSRLQRQRLVLELLRDELAGGLHAITMDLRDA